MNVSPGATFEWLIEGFASGIGTSGSAALGVRIRDGAGANFLARATSGLVEDVTVGAKAVYRRSFTAPDVAGQYWLVADDGVTTKTEELVVTHNAAVPVTPSGRDLCALADVIGYVPAYSSDETTDAKLGQLISAESDVLNGIDEIVTTGDDDPRIFAVDSHAAYVGRVEIDNLITLEDAIVAVHDRTGALVETVDVEKLIPLYRGSRRPEEPWEPITSLEFRTSRGAPRLFAGYELRITGTWGHPYVADFVREGCAAAVVLRYLSDVAETGTDFAEAADTVNFGGLASRRDEAIGKLQRPVFA